jgi:hypothetical protein
MDTNPVAEVAPSPESQLEAIFARQTGEAKPEGDDVEETDVAQEEASDTEDDDSDEAGDGQSDEAPDEVELTVGDEVKKLTKSELAELVAKRDSFQKDYTQKTQEVAERRRSIEDREQYVEAREQLMQQSFQEAAKLQALQEKAAQFQQIDWNALVETDPQRAMQLSFARQQLQTELTEKQQLLQRLVEHANGARAKHAETQIELGRVELQRRVGTLTAADRQKTWEQGVSLGFSEAELSRIPDPRVMHAIYKAAKWDALQASKPLTAKKIEQAKPMQAPAARSGNQSIEQSKREALKTRAVKSGKSADAEAYLERLFSNKRKR